MVASLKSWPLVIAVTLCVLFCLGTLVDAYPQKPEHPGENASAEEMARYLQSLREYLTLMSRPRFGKRFSPETLILEHYPEERSLNIEGGDNDPSWFDDSDMW